MQKGHTLQFSCQACKNPITFSIFDLQGEGLLHCESCKKPYLFSDDNLIRQLKKFDALCRQIRESEEILGQASIGINIGEHQVNIPYKLLLTRLNSSLDLMIGDQPVSIEFRFEPSKDTPY